ncbi:MAG: ABC transporter permease, partial [Candidatus Omnitrophica bacterium]|nr:ABC transporter permease [Candidatus Omnitrophota bacterium]
LLFWILGWASDLADPWLAEWLRNISLIDHFRNFTRGLLDTRDIIFFLFFTGFFLAMTALRLEARSLRGLK